MRLGYRICQWTLAPALALVSAPCVANPLVLFTAGSEDSLQVPRLLRLPQQGLVPVEVIASACNLGRGGDLRVYDLASGDCAEIAGPGRPAAHQPSLDALLEGDVLEGRPVQEALDMGHFVWYDLRTDRACVAEACLVLFGSTAPVSVTVDSFTATPEVIEIDEQTVLAWDSTGATSCTLSDDRGGGSVDVTTSGSVVRSPLFTTVFSLTCRNDQSSDSREATVTVTNSSEIIFLDGFEDR